MLAAKLGWRWANQHTTFGQVSLGGDEEAGGLPVHVMVLWAESGMRYSLRWLKHRWGDRPCPVATWPLQDPTL